MTTLFVLLLAAIVGGTIFLNTSPAAIAAFLRKAGPALMILTGGILLLTGRIGLGAPLIIIGIGLWRRMGGIGTIPRNGGQRRTNVRSAALEMELDHETGDMNGVVLTGSFEGRVLDELEILDLLALREEIEADSESLALLDAYFDRRLPGWREDAQSDAGAGQGGAPGTGPMNEEEAYEVLGLAPGASAAEIRKAHRRLMKGMHPDSGGSTFLAAKINEAKDVLLRSHS